MPDILTKAEVEGDVEDLDAWHMNACHTIEAMAELLERYHKAFTLLGEKRITVSECMMLGANAIDLLATYHGTKGEDDASK